MIEVKNLVKTYGNVKALKGLDFTVEKGKIVGLLGQNGAGKSTTMNILTGYLSATDGEVKIGGYDILDEPLKAKKQIGYLPEIPPLYDDMTVKQYLDFVCKIKGLKSKERQAEIERVVHAVMIDQVEHRIIKNLSKGYKQRVGLAQALIGNPPLLILDEPTVGLDPGQILEIRELIKGLGKNHTIILSSHILSEVNAICDYIMIIDEGKVVAQDTPENLKECFSDHSILKMKIKGEEEEVTQILAKLPYIDSWEIIQKEKEILDMNVKLNTGQDVRDDMFFAFANEKIPVLQMEKDSISLEDIFMKLTNGEDERC